MNNLDKLSADNLRGIAIDTYKKYQCTYNIYQQRINVPTVLPNGDSSFSAVLIKTKRRKLDAKGEDYAKVKAEEGKARGVFSSSA